MLSVSNRTIFSMLLVIVVCSLSVKARADILSTASTAVATEGIKSLINESIRQAEQSGDYLTFRLGTELRLSIEAFERSNSKLLDKTFSELSEHQQAFLTGTDRIATRLSKEVGKSLEKIEDVSNQWHNLVSSTIIGDGVPVVSSYRPAIFTPLDINKTFRVGIKGANLNREPPSLATPNGAAALSGNTSVLLTFSSEGLNPEFLDSATSLIDTELTLYRPADSWWGRVIGQSEPMVFKLPIMVGPKNLGKYKLDATYSEDVERTDSKSENFSHSSGTADWNCDSWNRGPSIDGRHMRNITASVTRSYRAANHQIKSSNSLGFSLEICARRWSDVNFKKVGSGPSDRHVTMSWTEYWTEKVEKIESSSGKFEWGKDISIKMPSTTTSFILTIYSFDGREIVFTGSGAKSLFDVVYDIAGKQVTISQIDPSLVN